MPRTAIAIAWVTVRRVALQPSQAALPAAGLALRYRIADVSLSEGVVGHQFHVLDLVYTRSSSTAVLSSSVL